MLNNKPDKELIIKYKLAGKIRFISFSLLLFFLLLMKSIGGYYYLNAAFITLILVEAILNQPYNFIIRKVNIYRFQYYQMITDIIVISWVLHYMGGVEAPLITIAYYVVILWAGVVSSIQAVFFAVIASVVFFSSIVICEHFGILPFVSYYDYRVPTAQLFSLLFGNVSFLFAFGYFTARSSRVVASLQRKRQEESLRNMHRLSATGYLVSGTAHDTLNYFSYIRGYTRVLLERQSEGSEESKILKTIESLGRKGSYLLTELASFSHKPEPEFKSIDIHQVIEDALGLAWPLIRYSNMTIEKIFMPDVPFIMANKNQLQEVFVVLVLNSLDAISKQGKLTIKTAYLKKSNMLEISFSDTGMGIKREDLKQIGEPFFTTKDPEKGRGLGLTTAYGIIGRHNGKIYVESIPGKGATFTIHLPVV